MSTWGDVATAAWSFVTVAAVIMSRRFWRNETRAFDRFHRAHVRGLPVAVFFAAPAYVLFVVAALLDEWNANAWVQLGVLGLFVLLVTVGFVLSWAIQLFGRPRRLVPPHMRSGE